MHHKLLTITSLLAGLTAGQNDEGTHYANHVFNSVHAVMRHPDLAYFSTGMSFFLANVPQGTQFYHGTGHSEPIKGLEWLAFEPEHALVFASMSQGRRPGAAAEHEHEHELRDQQPLHELQEQQEQRNGYLHTYVTNKDLRLLYIDGMSGGPQGSQSQDRILFNDSISSGHNDERLHVAAGEIGGPPQEQRRALLACEMARETWQGRIDGLLRTEGDFEIILCNFERDLDIVRIMQTKPRQKSLDMDHGKDRGNKGKPGRGPGKRREINVRYDDIRGHQAKIDFNHVVSAYEYGLELFPDNATEPQLGHIPHDALASIRQDIDTMILAASPARYTFNWQAITDVIVDRYAGPLRKFAEGNFSSASALREELEGFFAPFLDYATFPAGSDAPGIISSCQAQLIPATAPTEGLVAQSVRHVLFRVCSTFTGVLVEEDVELEDAVQRFEELVDYLGWREFAKAE